MSHLAADIGVILSLEGAELPLSGTVLLDLMRDVFAKGKPFRFTAKGHSMVPFVWEGDVISIEPLQTDQIKHGSVVAFIHPQNERLTVHRVVGRKGTAFLLQGDNAAGAPDGLVTRDRILGQVVRVERQGRRVRYGLGLERYMIALLSRFGLLLPIYFPLMSMLGAIQRLRRR